ncbi:MAG: PaaI family thioesterase [Burkholderiales bacterium]
MTEARNGAPVNPHWESRIRHELGVQGVTPIFEVVIDDCAPGRLTLSMPLKTAALQQYKVVHGGVVAMLADTASGLAVVSLLPAEDGVLSIEFKINLLSPSRGERMIARSSIVKIGRTVAVSEADIFCLADGVETHTARLVNTLIVARGIAARVDPKE